MFEKTLNWPVTIPFWNKLFSKSLLNFSKLLVGGDLNVSLGLFEPWGPDAQLDPLADFFLNKIQMGRLIDLDILKEKPTWRNRRVGEARVAKRLDRFLIKEDMAAQIHFFRQWVSSRGG